MKKRKCSWRKARERTTMDETWVTPDDTLVLERKDDNAILEPSALVVRYAPMNKLYNTNVSCEWCLVYML